MFINNPNIVNKTPIITIFLLEGANVQQIFEMWNKHSSLGQSLWGWVSVGIALVLWANFYRVICPKEKIAFYSTIFGIVMNICVIISVIYFKYFYI